MQYIIDEIFISETPIYKNYKPYEWLTTENKIIAKNKVKTPELFYYLIEGGQLIDYIREKKDSKLEDNCRIATKLDIVKNEINNARKNNIKFLDNYKTSKKNVKITYQNIPISFLSDIDSTIDELNLRVSAGSNIGLPMITDINILKQLLQLIINFRHELRSNVEIVKANYLDQLDLIERDTLLDNINYENIYAKLDLIGSYNGEVSYVFPKQIEVTDYLK